MTVKELIEKLEKYDGDLEVRIAAYDVDNIAIGDVYQDGCYNVIIEVE